MRILALERMLLAAGLGVHRGMEICVTGVARHSENGRCKPRAEPRTPPPFTLVAPVAWGELGGLSVPRFYHL